MKMTPLKIGSFLGSIIILMCCHALLALKPIKEFAPTYDEPVHLTAGFIYWKTADYRFNGTHHPPFGEMWAAIPLLWTKTILPVHDPRWIKQTWLPADQYQFADLFLYKNHGSAEKMLVAGRLMQLLMSLGFGIALMTMAFYYFGPLAALGSGLFWAFSPTFLTQASLVSTDLAFAVFYFVFFAGMLWPHRPTRIAIMGVSLGLCLASKYFSLLAFVGWGAVFICNAVFHHFRLFSDHSFSPQKKSRHGIHLQSNRAPSDNYLQALYKKWFSLPYVPKITLEGFANSWKSVLDTVVILLVAFLSLSMVMQFQGIDVWWDGFKLIWSRSQAGRGSFFFGERLVEGSLLYFPAVFLIKTPIPLLLAGIITLWKWRAVKNLIPLWLPAMLFFAAACLSKVQIGHRHILAVYPFLMLLCAVAISQLSKRWLWAGVPLLAWYVFGTVHVAPHFLAYFNEFIGGPAQGYKKVTDSNVDWGQGLAYVAQSLEPQDLKNGIYLAYFGVADPRYYGLKVIDVGSDQITGRIDDHNDPSVRPTKFVISATHLQGTYYKDPNAFSWLSEYTPWKTIAHSIFIYDFSDKPMALAQLERYRRYD